MIGLKWQMFAIVGTVSVLLAVGWRWQAAWNVKQDWKRILGLSVAVCALTQLLYLATAHWYGPENSIHIEVLLPAFVIGMLMKHRDHDTPRRTPRLNGHLVPVHAAGGNEHATGDRLRGVRRGRGSRIGHRRTADDAVGRPAAARRSRIGTFQPRKARPGLLLPRPAAERTAGPLGGHVHPRRSGRRGDLHRPRVQPRRPGAHHLGADAGAEPHPHGRLRRLGQTAGAPKRRPRRNNLLHA